MAFCKSLSHSKMHFNGNFMSRGVKIDICGLDRSGSQPFILLVYQLLCVISFIKKIINGYTHIVFAPMHFSAFE